MSISSALSEHDWDIRLFAYEHFVKAERPPTVAETAAHFGLSEADAGLAHRRLHDNHALFLDMDTLAIRMANPLSAVETPFTVFINGRRLWANCAWDSLGIPAMLHTDADIEVALADGETVTYTVKDGALEGEMGVVHFPLPFSRWYDDLVYT